MRTTTEIYNENKKWTLTKANEYLKAFMQENNVEPDWEIENQAPSGRRGYYSIKNDKLKLSIGGCDTMNRLVNNIHNNPKEHIDMMNKLINYRQLEL